MSTLKEPVSTEKSYPLYYTFFGLVFSTVLVWSAVIWLIF